jgi:hypothetical protein
LIPPGSIKKPSTQIVLAVLACQNTQRNIQADDDLHDHRRKDLKSHMTFSVDNLCIHLDQAKYISKAKEMGLGL